MISKQITFEEIDILRVNQWQSLMNLDSFSATVRKIVRDFLDGHNNELTEGSA